MPAYKQVLVESQGRALALAGLAVLEAVSALHTMLGASHTRFASVIIPIFESAVLLLCLCIKGALPSAQDKSASNQNDSQDPHHCRNAAAAFFMGRSRSGAHGLDITTHVQQDCIEATRDALGPLKIMAELSAVAEAGQSSR